MLDHKKILADADPVFILFLGACPAVACSGSIKAALGIGVAVLLVMLLSAVVMALIGPLTEKALIAAAVLVTAFFASAVHMLMNAYLPGVFNMLGVYLAVIAVDLMVFSVAGRQEKIGKAAKNALFAGLGFTAAVVILAGARVLLGGLIPGFAIPIVNKVQGGLVLFAIELAVINAVRQGKKEA